MPILTLLIPILAPLITELCKWFVAVYIPDEVIKKLPPTALPALSAAVGGILTVVGPTMGVDLGGDVTSGAVFGLAGSGVYSTLRSATDSKS